MHLDFEDEKKSTNFPHEKFYEISIHNLIIVGSDAIEGLNKTYKCSDVFCLITDE